MPFLDSMIEQERTEQEKSCYKCDYNNGPQGGWPIVCHLLRKLLGQDRTPCRTGTGQ